MAEQTYIKIPDPVHYSKMIWIHHTKLTIFLDKITTPGIAYYRYSTLNLTKFGLYQTPI